MININNTAIQSVDKTKNIVIPGDKETTIQYCVDHFLQALQESIERKKRFAVALSGGSTPKAMFERIARMRENIKWSHVFLFWSDERSVPPTDPDSNYYMAMHAGFQDLPIPKNQIFRMHAEDNILSNAKKYEELIKDTLDDELFDLVMLGMGEDGHTASLFPETKALEISDQLVAANFVPQKDTWRMTLTYPCINQSKKICLYVMGGGKKEMLKRVLQPEKNGSMLPVQRIGSKEHKALWIADHAAASLLR